MRTLDGKTTSAKILESCKAEAESLTVVPGLAVVIVGDDPASHAYVRNKVRTCGKLGFHSQKLELPASTTQQELIDVVHQLNADPKIHGILVQSPPPVHIDESAVVLAIDPRKDVDGFHPENVAKLALDDGSGFAPCTPLGCQLILEDHGIEIEGRHVVILGRSMIVGKSLALLLLQKGRNANATVTVAHSRTKDIAAVSQKADILVAAIGRPHFVTPNFVRDGAIVVDVGINRVDDPESEKGYKLVGDVDYDAIAPKCEAITPVPGGIGPMTIAMLMKNTLKAARQQTGQS
ncbi:MAG: bifunctional 5,10-methylenetetrahydrofolate dehydrogenase/5,10-methenyltetrahydrofolate cyclohydrolase [Verrucomicrobiota bacterium]